MENMKNLFRNGCIATVGFVAANSAFAADSLLDETTTATVSQAQSDGMSMGKLIIAAVAIVVGVSLIVGLMRKA